MFCNVAQFIIDLALWSVFVLPIEVTFRVLAAGRKSRTPIGVVDRRNQLLCGGFKASEVGIMAYEQIMQFFKREWFFPFSYRCRDFSKITAQSIENVQGEIIICNEMIDEGDFVNKSLDNVQVFLNCLSNSLS